MLGAGFAEDFFFQVGDACVELGVLMTQASENIGSARIQMAAFG